MTWVSKVGERENHDLDYVMRGDNLELKQRFEYVRQVLTISKGFRYKTKDEEEMRESQRLSKLRESEGFDIEV